MQKNVYLFEEIEMPVPDLLGAKGTGLVQAMQMNMPVPQGFIITTQAGLAYFNSGCEIPTSLLHEVQDALTMLSVKVGRTFGDPASPFLISVRSGAPFSMPGQMSSILNIGLNDELVQIMPDRRLALDLYWRFHRMLGIALGIDKRNFQNLETTYLYLAHAEHPSQLSVEQLEELIHDVRVLILGETGKLVPQDPLSQLWMAIQAVWQSWNSVETRLYRRSLGTNNEICTAVVVQAMALGNMNSRSGSGVVYSHDLISGKPISGSFLFQAQGEDIVGGEQRTTDIEELSALEPKLFEELIGHIDCLAKYYKYPVEVEFTIEDGHLWILQVRKAHLSDRAFIQYLIDMEAKGETSKAESVERVRPSLMERLGLPVFSLEAKELARREGRMLTRGIPASPGVGVGVAVVSHESAMILIRNNKPFVWIREALDPKEYLIMKEAKGIVSILSSIGSHGAIIANAQKKPCIVSCDNIDEINEEAKYFIIGDHYLTEDTQLSVDGTYGEVFLGSLPIAMPESFRALDVFKEWWDIHDGTKGNVNSTDGRPHSPWGNATYAANSDEIETVRQQARNFLRRNRWSTEKAQAVEVMHVVPENIRIKQVVIDAHNKEKLEFLMHDVIEKGYWCGLRTTLGPGTEGSSPVQFAIQTHKQVEEFLSNPDFQGIAGTLKGGYPRWMNPGASDKWLAAPEQIIVVYDPPEKGSESVDHEHFACTVTCSSNPDEVAIDMNLGAVSLRSLERVALDRLIRLRVALNPGVPYLLGQRLLTFGKRHWQRKNLRDVADILKLPYSRIDEIENAVKESLEEGIVSEDTLELLVGIRTLKIARFVEKIVLDEWWKPPLKLPFMMRALDEVFSMQVLEIQGRANEDGDIKWCLIFDTKGREEKRTADESNT